MRKLILPIMLILCSVTIGLNGCFFILKGYTSSTLLFPADIEDRKKVDKQTLRVYPIQVLFDSTDLTAYEIVGYRYDSSSIRNVETRISKRFDSFWRQQTNISVQKKQLGNFSDLVDAEVFVRQRPMGDQNNNTAFRSISRISSRFLLSDTFYHFITEATLRQDICIGCSNDGWQKDMFAVLHLRYAILHVDKVYYYRELIIPKPIDRTRRNIFNTDAAKSFDDIIDRIAFSYLEKDLRRLLK